MTHPANIDSIVRAANRCHLAISVDSGTKELYGYAVPVLDEVATLRRVALLRYGCGRHNIPQDERDAALATIRGRFESRFN